MVKIDLKIPDLSEVFRRHQTEIMQGLAATMQANRSMMFDKDGADNGKEKWAPLVLRKGGRPLQKSGTLRKSWGPQNDGKKPVQERGSVIRFEGEKVTIGSNLLYAGMMNDGTTKMPGGKLVPVRALALKIPLEDGSFMFRRSVKIPARTMNEITSEDAKEFSESMARHIAEILRREAV